MILSRKTAGQLNMTDHTYTYVCVRVADTDLKGSHIDTL